ncbi:hypothetical protein DE146DRAFT_667790 [Phaeosphaeria sp. MPI-PUGE-AT-0046c]|nr:hypothetical protein DE146DRAFT_667790 [Phaeosphaeria sp. MPI-PUGE-AT-0046c]
MQNTTTNMHSTKSHDDKHTATGPADHVRPEMPPPPYFRTYLVNPSSFKAAINTRTDKPIVSLFRLSVRLLQFAFAMAAGISYAVELSERHPSETSTFIYAQVVFGLTLLTLVLDSILARSYRIIWLVEWVLVVLWFVCFAVFYQAYLAGSVGRNYQGTDIGRMGRAVWCDLINALLWLSSAMFSSTMCCTGMIATIRNKFEQRRDRKERRAAIQKIEDMESGTTGIATTPI